MTRTAAAARVARACDFRNGLQSATRNLSFDRAFGNKEARANQRFIACPIVARGVAVLTNRRQQRVTSELRAMFSPWLRFSKLQRASILPDDGGFGSRDIDNPFGQYRRRRNQHTATRRLKPRLRQPLMFIDLNRKPHMRAAN